MIQSGDEVKLICKQSTYVGGGGWGVGYPARRMSARKFRHCLSPVGNPRERASNLTADVNAAWGWRGRGGNKGFCSSKEERNFTFWPIASFSQKLIADSGGTPPLEKGVGGHSLMAEKHFKAGEGEPYSCPRLGRDRSGMRVLIS